MGNRALGPGKTISGGLQGTLAHAKAVDEQKGYSKQASDVCALYNRSTYLLTKYDDYQYYTKALSSPLGQRVKEFYTTTSHQIHDIHEEARRIADSHKQSSPTASPQPQGTESPSGAPAEATKGAAA